jgi:hypothetical protein
MRLNDSDKVVSLALVDTDPEGLDDDSEEQEAPKKATKAKK